MTEHTTSTDTPPEAEATPEAELGDAGRKALQAERDARKAAETRAQDAESRLAEVERAEVRRTVAAEKGLTAEMAKHLQGDDAEAMAAHADEMLAAFRPAEEDTSTGPPRRPRERLKSGAVPGATPERSMGDVAADVLGS